MIQRLFAVLLLIVGCAAAVSAQPVVSLCDLTANREQYNGKVVHVRTTYYLGFEASAVSDDRCRNDHTWVELDPALKEATAPRVYRQWERAFIPVDRHLCESNVILMPMYVVDVTFVARFQSISYRKGDERPQGFGHMGGCDFNLTVLSVERVGRATEQLGGFDSEPGVFTITCGMVDRLPL
jgi:hypothetical protein